MMAQWGKNADAASYYWILLEPVEEIWSVLAQVNPEQQGFPSPKQSSSPPEIWGFLKKNIRNLGSRKVFQKIFILAK